MDVNRDAGPGHRLTRFAPALATSLLLACVPAASAADPLLSGYSGPGGGEQVILGAEVLPSAGATPAPASRTAARPAAPARPTGPAASPADDADRPTTPERSGGAADGAVEGAAPAREPTTAATATPIPYPDGDAASTGLPLGDDDLVVLALIVTAACAAAASVTRLQRWGAR